MISKQELFALKPTNLLRAVILMHGNSFKRDLINYIISFRKVISTISYKKSTIAFLQEILNFYGKENNLNMYLSNLSEYKYPKMEELYELAQTFGGI